MHLIKQSPTLWAVYNEDNHTIDAEGLTASQLADYALQKEKRTFLTHLKNYTPSITWEQAQVLSGRISCCDCGCRVDVYNQAWPLDKQRCSICLEG